MPNNNKCPYFICPILVDFFLNIFVQKTLKIISTLCDCFNLSLHSCRVQCSLYFKICKEWSPNMGTWNCDIHCFCCSTRSFANSPLSFSIFPSRACNLFIKVSLTTNKVRFYFFQCILWFLFNNFYCCY
jgi:hypothetical protein